ncbi:MAG: hypothetical protein BGO02_06635 [Brevundimonas sp. 67-6]|nr:MAG: hypothetical protein BGO02_06635 [Brevundimonas sp. 67-6]
MAMLPIKGVHVVRSKGRTYTYAWRGGPRIHSEPGSPEFVAELASLTVGRQSLDASRMASLCAAWRGSDHWQKEISAKTRQNWSPWLDRIQEHFGKTSISAFDRPLIRVAIRKWRDQYKATPRAADVGLETLSRLLSFGMAEGRLMTNAVVGMPRLYKSDRSMIIWTSEDMTALEAVSSPQMIAAFKLAALTGLRTSDLLRLSWSHIGPLAIEMSTGKSRHRKTTLIPLYGELREHLATIPKRSTTVLTNQDGHSWRTGFASSFQKAKTRAGIDKHFHDFRGTAATRMYMGGLDEREIAEIFTWSEEHVADMMRRYVKKDELLLDRIRRLDKLKPRTSAVKPAVKPG